MTNQSYSTQVVPTSPLFLGVDLGTSGCRAIAIDATGQVKAQSQLRYKATTTQTPELWWQATQTVIQEITQQTKHHHIKAISIDGTSGSVMLCDAHGKVISPVLMYNDARATAQAAQLKTIAPEHSIVVSATSGLAKVLWLLEHYPPQKPFHIIHQADWVAGQLCQRFNFTDCNNALKTGYDPVNKHWPLWLTDMSFDQQALPEVLTPGDIVANIDPVIASQLNLPFDVDIVAGTTDSTAAIYATGAIHPGEAITSLGSTLVIKVISEHPVSATEYGVYSQPYGNNWLVGGASNSGGAVLRYFFSDEQIKTLSEKIKPEIKTGLHYYPLLQPGERFPVNDPNFAPQLNPKVDDDVEFFQGLLEGIANIELTGYQLLHDKGAPYPSSVRTVGGGAINMKWQAIQQSMLNVEMITPQHTEAAYGSALIAASAYK